MQNFFRLVCICGTGYSIKLCHIPVGTFFLKKFSDISSLAIIQTKYIKFKL